LPLLELPCSFLTLTLIQIKSLDLLNYDTNSSKISGPLKCDTNSSKIIGPLNFATKSCKILKFYTTVIQVKSSKIIGSLKCDTNSRFYLNWCHSLKGPMILFELGSKLKRNKYWTCLQQWRYR
jgi:hypothetical protein